MSTGPELVRAIPVLPCLDIARAVTFYAERLDFATSAREFAVKDADGNTLTFAEDAFGA